MEGKFIPSILTRFLHQGEVLGPQGTLDHFTRRNPMVTSKWFVDGQNGSDRHDGRDPRSPLKTIAGAIAKGAAGDQFYLVGNFTEEVTVGPSLEDVSFISVSGRPRHADHARDATYAANHGCSWRDASTPAGPLVIVRAQGVRFEGILLVPPTATYPAIKLERNALSGTSEYDASHAQVVDCRFAGGLDGINDAGGCFNVLIQGCSFHDQTGDGIKTTSTSVAVPLAWVVEYNRFWGNANHIRCSANHWVVRYNSFGYFTNFSVSLAHVSAQGERNQVYGNYFSGDYDGEYLGGANDEWAGNMTMDAGTAEAIEPWTIAAPVA